MSINCLKDTGIFLGCVITSPIVIALSPIVGIVAAPLSLIALCYLKVKDHYCRKKTAEYEALYNKSCDDLKDYAKKEGIDVPIYKYGDRCLTYFVTSIQMLENIESLISKNKGNEENIKKLNGFKTLRETVVAAQKPFLLHKKKMIEESILLKKVTLITPSFIRCLIPIIGGYMAIFDHFDIPAVSDLFTWHLFPVHRDLDSAKHPPIMLAEHWHWRNFWDPELEKLEKWINPDHIPCSLNLVKLDFKSLFFPYL